MNALGLLDKVALAVVVFPVATLLFWPAGIWLYQWRKGTESFRRRTSGYFLWSAALAACLPGGAALLIARFVPLPSIAGYVYGGMLAIAGIMGGCKALSNFIHFVVMMSYRDALKQWEAVESVRLQRAKKPRRNPP